MEGLFFPTPNLFSQIWLKSLTWSPTVAVTFFMVTAWYMLPIAKVTSTLRSAMTVISSFGLSVTDPTISEVLSVLNIPGHTFLFFEAKLQVRGRFTQVIKTLPQVVSLEVWVQGPSFTQVWCALRVIPWNLKAEGVIRVTKWCPFHLEVSWSCGLHIFQVFSFIQSPGQKRWWAKLVGAGSTWLPYSMRVSCFPLPGGHIELFHFKRVKVSFLSGLENESTT